MSNTLAVWIQGMTQRLGDMNRKFCNDFKLDYDACICLGFHGDGVPYTKSLKSASIEVFNWNLLNEFDSERHLFATVPKDITCDCGCHGRDTFDAVLDILLGA